MKRCIDRVAVSRIRGVLLVVTLGAATLALVPAQESVQAHARLLESTPEAGSALEAAPEEIRLAFSEPIDAQFSRAELLTSAGERVPTGPIETDPSDRSIALLRLPNPAALGRGRYTLVWRVLSAADGHVTTGSLPFGVGTGASPVGPESNTSSVRPPWWRVAGRWLELASLMVVVGGFAFSGIVVPFVRSSRLIGRSIVHLWNVVWWGAGGAALLGLAFTFVDQGFIATGSSLTDPPGPGVYRRLLTETTFGNAWLLRLALLLVLGLTAFSIGRRNAPRSAGWITGLIVGAAMLATIPVAGHAAAEPHRTWAIVNDWLHLLGASVWLGGLVFVLVSLVSLARNPEPEAGTAGAGLVAQFSLVALLSVGTLLASGVVNAAFHVAGPSALRDQDYGLVLIAKFVLVLAVLIAAAVNLLVNRPRLIALAHLGEFAALRRHLSVTTAVVAIEVAIGATIVAAAAALTELPPADAPLTVDVAAKTVVIDQRAVAGDLDVWMLGRLAGYPDDRYTVTLSPRSGGSLDGVQRVIVEASLGPAEGTGGPIQDRFDADPLSGSPESYTFPATRLGLQGQWDVRAIVRRAGLDDVVATFAVDTREAGIVPPRLEQDTWRLPRLTPAAWALLMLALLVVAGGVVGVRRLPGLEPLAAGLLLTMVALIAIGFGVSAARQTIPVSDDTDLANPFRLDAGSVQRGAGIYSANCLVCHGADGTGPVASDPEHVHGKGADLTDTQSREQRDGDLYHAVTAGVPGSAMPAYDVALTDDERWDVVNYLRELQRGPRDITGTPTAVTSIK